MNGYLLLASFEIKNDKTFWVDFEHKYQEHVTNKECCLNMHSWIRQKQLRRIF